MIPVGPSIVAVVAAVLAAVSPAFAQTAAPAPSPAPTPAPVVKKWTTSFSLGLTLTRGNTDTTTLNTGYDVKYDPKRKNILTSQGLFIRGTNAGRDSTNRLGVNFRDEHRANTHYFVYVQGQFLRDPFKEIDYLVAPTAGVGINALDRAATKLSINAGAGGVWEQNTRRTVRQSGALTLGERWTQILSPAVTFTQSFSALWKMENLSDSLYTLVVTLAASITARTQFKVEWVDTYKNLPPAANVKKNDVSMIVAFVVRK